jgi:hypothetical protein
MDLKDQPNTIDDAEIKSEDKDNSEDDDEEIIMDPNIVSALQAIIDEHGNVAFETYCDALNHFPPFEIYAIYNYVVKCLQRQGVVINNILTQTNIDNVTQSEDNIQ